MKNKAPWKDFKGNDIFENDTIEHPSGQRGIVVYYPSRPNPGDSWVVKYFGDTESRLCLQVGNKGQAIVIN